MKKGRNTPLLIGLVCVSAALLWQMIKAVFEYFSIIEGYTYFVVWSIVPMVITLLLLIVPILLLVRNGKNKTGNVLSIISIVLNSVVLLWTLFGLVTPTIPQYLIVSKLGLIDTYVMPILRFLESGGVLFLVGYILLIVGSVLSLPGKKAVEHNTREVG